MDAAALSVRLQRGKGSLIMSDQVVDAYSTLGFNIKYASR